MKAAADTAAALVPVGTIVTMTKVPEKELGSCIKAGERCKIIVHSQGVSDGFVYKIVSVSTGKAARCSRGAFDVLQGAEEVAAEKAAAEQAAAMQAAAAVKAAEKAAAETAAAEKAAATLQAAIDAATVGISLFEVRCSRRAPDSASPSSACVCSNAVLCDRIGQMWSPPVGCSS